MIAKIKGIISDIYDKSVVIDTVSGVSYEVFMTYNNLKILKLGEETEILTEQVIREDSNTLYGFFTIEDKKTFIVLQKVSGVGPKMAMQILEQFNFSDLQKAIENGDASLFKQVSGVGNKLAMKIIVELKGSIDLSANLQGKKELSPAKSDAVSGLVNLGYKAQDVKKVVSEIDSDDTAEIIKIALKTFGK